MEKIQLQDSNLHPAKVSAELRYWDWQYHASIFYPISYFVKLEFRFRFHPVRSPVFPSVHEARKRIFSWMDFDQTAYSGRTQPADVHEGR